MNDIPRIQEYEAIRVSKLSADKEESATVIVRGYKKVVRAADVLITGRLFFTDARKLKEFLEAHLKKAIEKRKIDIEYIEKAMKDGLPIEQISSEKIVPFKGKIRF